VETKKATENDTDKVWTIINKCSQMLLEQGQSHWAEYYTVEIIRKKVKKEDVRLAYLDGSLVATVTVSYQPVEYYTEEDMQNFEEPKQEAIYISALATDPEYQGRGIASKLMETVEMEALEKGIEYARIDVKALFPELVNFYRKRDYIVVGVLIDHDDDHEPYFLMEKKLRGS
jgi:GNAT superfamily N-acetyltransferase